MEHTYEASTVEMDRSGFESLQEQLLNNKSEKAESKDIRAQAEESKKQSTARKFVLSKGEESFELDDDYEIEFMADKKPTKLTLRELKDRAAGDIAVKNRMHSLAEEKKRIQATFKEFSSIAKKDPLGALEFISKQANEADSEFEYSNYLKMLADQAEKLGNMDEKERKAWDLEKKLEKVEQDLSYKERQQAVVLRKQQLQADYPEIGDSQFTSMVEAVLNSEELLEGLESEQDVMNRVEELIQETLVQKDIMDLIREINPTHVRDNDLIFTLSDQIRQNPDLDEDDVRDILRELIGKSTPSNKEKDVRTLSQKARQAAPMSSLKTQESSAFDLLKQQLLERKEEINKTPLWKR